MLCKIEGPARRTAGQTTIRLSLAGPLKSEYSVERWISAPDPPNEPDRTGQGSTEHESVLSRKRDLPTKYPDSPACSCNICLRYCTRPGWWTVDEASRALEAGYGQRMMLEMSPDRAFGVLAPAYKGCETEFSTRPPSDPACTFLVDTRCQLHDTGYQPLECRVCHHDRPGMGPRCHADIEKEWNTSAGRALVVEWSNRTDFWRRMTGARQKGLATAPEAGKK